MAYIAGVTGQPVPANFEADFRERTFARFKTDIRPVEGIEEVIKSLSVPYCVASSGPPHKIRMNLELTGLANYFGERIFSCYDLGKWKPDPAVFLHAAATMGFRPADCLVIEDSPVGVRGAVAAGMPVIGLASAHSRQELVAAGAHPVSHPRELLKLLPVADR